MRSTALFLLLCLVMISCHEVQQEHDEKNNLPLISQDSIIDKYLRKGAWNYPLYSREWQEEIDKGLTLDSTIAYLWQQKAMPLFKHRKYEIGMVALDNAVKYNEEEYLEYRAFMKCIFSKAYVDAIKDFDLCLKKYGNNIVMDHSYKIYKGICLLQLNRFDEAEELFDEELNSQIEKETLEWVHHLDLYYWAISKFEQRKYLEAINIFDKCLEKYPQFSDAYFYKASSLKKINKDSEADHCFNDAVKFQNEGYTINEDNAIYELYPYQIRKITN